MNKKTKKLIWIGIIILILITILFYFKPGFLSVTEKVTCSSNSDCNDANQNTEDVCMNPGQVNSYCKMDNLVRRKG